MRHATYPHLFSPLQVGTMTLPNRVVMVPTDISSGRADGSVNQRVITYHEEIAKGGCGFIIVGATTPDKLTGRPTVTCLAADEDPLIPGLANLAEAIQRHGAKCAVQIQHPGRQAAWPRKNLMSASDQVVDLPGSAGHEVIYAESLAQGKSIRAMSGEEIYDLVEKFAEAAWRVQQAGFDSVELHGAHGYLIAQFMSPYVNHRNDRFGGTFINRMRFALEIIHRIQMKCGKDYPIGIRYSGEEWVPGSRRLEESVEIAKLMEQQGLAYVDISAGNLRSARNGDGPDVLPRGLEHVRRRGNQEACQDPRHHQPHAAKSGILRANSRGRQGRPRRILTPTDRRSVLGQQGSRRQARRNSPLYLLPHRLLARIAHDQTRHAMRH